MLHLNCWSTIHFEGGFGETVVKLFVTIWVQFYQ